MDYKDAPSLEGLNLTKQLKKSLENGTLVYWEREDHLSREALEQAIRRMPDEGGLGGEDLKITWKPRESNQGTYAAIGEVDVFVIEFKYKSMSGTKSGVYIKGFLYPDGGVQGAEIQSCKILNAESKIRTLKSI